MPRVFCETDVEQLLDNRYFFGLQSLGAIGDLELDMLTFIQRSETIVCAENVSEVNENIGALFLFDKTEAFVRVKPFDGAGGYCRHNKSYKKDKYKKPLSKAGEADNVELLEVQDEKLQEKHRIGKHKVNHIF